jgi:hypothetical protein
VRTSPFSFLTSFLAFSFISLSMPFFKLCFIISLFHLHSFSHLNSFVYIFGTFYIFFSFFPPFLALFVSLFLCFFTLTFDHLSYTVTFKILKTFTFVSFNIRKQFEVSRMYIRLMCVWRTLTSCTVQPILLSCPT